MKLLQALCVGKPKQVWDQKMPKFTRSAALVALSVFGLTLVGCQNETPAQKEVNKQAQAIDDSYKAEAEVVESLAEGAPKAEQKAAESQADGLREEGKQIKDNLKDAAKELPKAK